MEHMIDVELIEKHQQQEYQYMWQILTNDGYNYLTIGLFDPLLTTIKLQFHAQRIGGYQKHKEHHHTRHKHGREIHIIV